MNRAKGNVRDTVIKEFLIRVGDDAIVVVHVENKATALLHDLFAKVTSLLTIFEQD